MADVLLCPDLTRILSMSATSGVLLALPEEQLDRKLYQKVAAAIGNAGGKWSRSKQAFVFSSNAATKVSTMLQSGVSVDRQKKRQAYYTPPNLAEDVAVAASVAGQRVLEPSAGDGNLVAACLKFGALHVDCVELEESCRSSLVGPGRAVTIADFLTLPVFTTFSRVVMNPPFTRGQYWKHVLRAIEWLAPGGELYAIVPDNECKKLSNAGLVTLTTFASGAFKESGASVRTRLVFFEQS